MKNTLVALALAFCAQVQTVNADDYITFNFNYSGAFYGNSAQANGFVTLNATSLNPSGPQEIFPSNPADTRILGLQITVSGASAGNGTFNYDDFWRIIWGTDGGTLDLSKELLGQPTTTGVWGPVINLIGGGPAYILTGDGNFDFALGPGIAHPGGPVSTDWFTITTSSGNGDRLLMTSMVAVPEPSALALFGLGAVGLFRVNRRTKPIC